MPENIRALIVILFLASIVFVFAHRYLSDIADARDMKRRRNAWFVLTLTAFLAGNFWLYSLLAIAMLLYLNRSEKNPPALFFILLFILPVATIKIPGGGMINYFFDLSHARIIALFVLLPAFIALSRQRDNLVFGRTLPDKLLMAYLLLSVALFLREPSVTNALRNTFYLFMDVFLPYFVLSRSLKNINVMRDALFSLTLVIMVLALLAIFEFSKHWLLYSYVTNALGLEGGKTEYLAREGVLRAIVTTGQPIALGYLMVIGIGIYLYLQRSIRHKMVRILGHALLAGGLLSPLSRGPWVGAVFLLFVFIATGHSPARRLMGMAVAAVLSIAILATLPGGERILNLLPFIGTTEKENVDYRERLINNSMIVIQRNPWFGSIDYLETPEMEAMRQGQGIIDIVNSYIQITLWAGIAGLSLFAGFFAMVLRGIYKAMRSIGDRESEEYLLGRALLSTLLAILLMIFTVSSITIIPIVYWSVAGVGVAYVQIIRKMG